MPDDLAGRIEHGYAQVAVTVVFPFSRPDIADTGRTVDDVPLGDDRAARSTFKVVLDLLGELAAGVIGQHAGLCRRIIYAITNQVITRSEYRGEIAHQGTKELLAGD